MDLESIDDAMTSVGDYIRGMGTFGKSALAGTMGGLGIARIAYAMSKARHNSKVKKLIKKYLQEDLSELDDSEENTKESSKGLSKELSLQEQIN